MEPVFEGLFVQDEALVRQALRVRGLHVKGWPAWRVAESRRPDTEILQKAIIAARRAAPRDPLFRAIRGDMRSSKHEWGRHLLDSLASTRKGRETLDGHPMILRMVELLGTREGSSQR
jgi:hypothetical protein